MTDLNLESKFLGGLLGSALGDCVGEIAFYMDNRVHLAQQVKSKSEIIYTDDTAMAIGITEALIENEGTLDPDLLGQIFHRNFEREPHRGYAMGPPTIFSEVDRTGKSYTEVASELFNGTGSYGNGASMRIAPIGLFYYDSSNLYELAKKSAMVTHAHPLGIDGAAVLAKAISILVDKDCQKWDVWDHREEYLEILIDFAQTEVYKKKLRQVVTYLSPDKELSFCSYELGSNVKSFESVPFSICAFLKNPHSFYDCILDTVMVSADRDTIGAMVGGLLGAYLGIDSIPQEWLERLENREYLRDLALKLIQLKSIRNNNLI